MPLESAFAEYRPNVEVFARASPQRPLGGADAVVPLLAGSRSLLAFDGKAHFDKGGANEINLGLLWRGMDSGDAWASGLYASYDRRRLRTGGHFYQMTVGAERRSAEWDMRINYYHPTTEKRLVGTGALQYVGFGLVRNGVYEEPMRGGDLELGYRLRGIGNVESRIFLAAYTFSGKDVAGSTTGARLRAEVRPSRDIVLGLAHQKDPMFGRATFFEVRYVFGKAPTRSPRTLRDRMTDPWQRDIDVAVSPRIESTDPALGQAVPGIRIVHVDSSKPEGGDGSAERPYRDTADCGKCADPAFSTVRLWKGHSSMASPYSSYAMQQGQTLLGEGFDPESSQVTGNYPVIGTTGAAITLANNSTVSGVHVRSQSGTGILGRNLNGEVVVRSNRVTVTASDRDAFGISIEDTGAGLGRERTLLISGNTVEVTGAPRVVTPMGGGVFAATGIAVQEHSGSAGVIHRLNLTLSQNQVSVNALSGSGGILLQYFGGEGTAFRTAMIADNNVFARSGAAVGGYAIMSVTSPATGSIHRSTSITGNSLTHVNAPLAGASPIGYGIIVHGGPSPPIPFTVISEALEITKNSIVTSGVGIGVPAASSTTPNVSVVISDNTISPATQ